MLNQTRLLCARFLGQLNKRRRQHHLSPKFRRRAFLESLESRIVLTGPDPTLQVLGDHDFAVAGVTGEGYLVIRGAEGPEYNNDLIIRRDAEANYLITDVTAPFLDLSTIPGATLSADKHTITVPEAAITGQRAYVIGGAGDDTLTLDWIAGDPTFANGLKFEGGDQVTANGDGIALTGGSVENVDYVFVNEHDGSIVVDGRLITYTGLEPINDNMDAVNRSFTFTGAAETVTISDVGGADGMTRIDSTLGEFVNFPVPSASLTIIANGGDTINITSFDAAFNTPLISLQGTTSNNDYRLTAANVIPDVSGLSLTGNANFTLNGFSETVGSLASTDAVPTVVLTAGNTLTVGDATNTAFSGIISGPGNLTKVGAGTLTLSGVNTYAGLTTISAGILNANSSAAIGNGSATNTLVLNGGRFQAAAAITSPATRGVVLNGASTSTIDTNNFFVTIAGVISGGTNGVTSLIVASTATPAAAQLILQGNNTFAGNLAINRGTVTAQSSNALGLSGPGNVTTLTGIDGTGANVPRLLLNGGTAVNIPESLFLLGTTAGRVTLEVNATVVHTVSGPIDVSSNTNLVNLTSNNNAGALSITGDITGTMSNAAVLFIRGTSTNTANALLGSVNLVGGSLRKTDASTWSIGAAGKTYSWPTDTLIAFGIVNFNVANVLPAGNTLTLGQGNNSSTVTINFNGFNQTTTGLIFNYAGTTTTSFGTINTGAGTLNLNGDVTFNTVAGNTTTSAINGNINLGGGTRTFNINDSTGSATEFSVNAVITNGGLTKTGAGLMALSGVSTYTGATTVTTGTLTLNGSIATSATTVQTGAILTGSGTTGPLTVNGTHSPGTPIAKMTVTGNYVENGALQLDIASPSSNVAGIDYDQVQVVGNGSVNIGASASLTVAYTGAAGTFAPAAGQVYTLIDNDGTAPGDTVGTFTGLAEGATVTLDGKTLTLSYIGGDGNDVVLKAPGVLVTALYVDASFTGSGTVDGDRELAGTQSATIGTTAFDTIAAALTANPGYSGPIFVNGGTYASAPLAAGGAVSLRLVQDLTAGELNVTISDLSGDVTDGIVTRFHNAATPNANVTIEQGAFSGVISGVGTVTKTTAGTLNLLGASTYSGQTTISAGTLGANSAAALGDGSATNTLVLNGGTLQAVAAFTSPATRGVVLNGATTSTIDTNNVALTIAGVISGGTNAVNSLTVVSTAGTAGNLVLQGNNTFAGNLIVNRGTVSAQNSNALGLSGAGNATTVNGADGTTAARLLLNAGTATTIAESLNLNASAAGRVTLEANSAAVHTLTGPIDVSSTGNLVNVTSNGTGGMTITGDITGTMSAAAVVLLLRGASTNVANFVQGSINLIGGGLTKTDPGLWRIGNAAETYSWAALTNVSAGTLRLAAANMLPPALDLQIGQSSNAANAILDLAGFSQTTNNINYLLAGTATTVNGQITTGAGTLTMNGNLTFTTVAAYTATTSLISGNLNLGGGTRIFNIGDSTGTLIELTISAIISNGGLTKSGTGLLVLSGANTYTGATTVTGGVLVVTGSITPSATTVQSGGALAGNGTTGLVTVDAGGTHAPGIPLGQQTVTGNYIENGTLQIEIATPSGNVVGTDYDQVRVVGSGSVTLTGATLAVNYTGSAGTFNPGPGQVYVLIDNDGTAPGDTVGTFSGLAQGATVTIDGKALTISYIGGDGNDVVLIAPGAAITTLYVNDQFPGSGTVDGDLETAGSQSAVIGTTAFASIAAALAANVGFAGDIIVNGGTYASALLAGGGNVTLRLVQDLTNAEPNVVFNDLSGSAGDAIALRFNNVANANLTVTQGTFSGVISGSGTLTKTTAGLLDLLGTNTYTGATTVTGGTLRVTGSTATSATTVQTGATITGVGTTGALTVNAGGIHLPGTGVGILTSAGNYVENGGLTIEIGTPAGLVAGTDYDQVRITASGSVAIGAAATLAVNYLGAAGTFNPAVGNTYIIINNDGTAPGDTTGNFAGLPAGATVTVDGKPMQIQYNGGDGNDVVLVAQAPVAALYVNDDFPATGTVSTAIWKQPASKAP